MVLLQNQDIIFLGDCLFVIVKYIVMFTNWMSVGVIPEYVFDLIDAHLVVSVF